MVPRRLAHPVDLAFDDFKRVLRQHAVDTT